LAVAERASIRAEPSEAVGAPAKVDIEVIDSEQVEKREPDALKTDFNITEPENRSPNAVDLSPSKDDSKLGFQSQDEELPAMVTLTQAEADELAEADDSDNEVDEDKLAGGLTHEVTMSAMSMTQYDGIFETVHAEGADEQVEPDMSPEPEKRGLGINEMSSSNSKPVESLSLKL